jgi:hypothetical protein
MDRFQTLLSKFNLRRYILVPSPQAFMPQLEAFHLSARGGGKPLRVPVFCHAELDLYRIFSEVWRCTLTHGSPRAYTDTGSGEYGYWILFIRMQGYMYTDIG